MPVLPLVVKLRSDRSLIHVLSIHCIYNFHFWPQLKPKKWGSALKGTKPLFRIKWGKVIQNVLDLQL